MKYIYLYIYYVLLYIHMLGYSVCTSPLCIVLSIKIMFILICSSFLPPPQLYELSVIGRFLWSIEFEIIEDRLCIELQLRILTFMPN